jgi:dynein heavy chain 1
MSTEVDATAPTLTEAMHVFADSIAATTRPFVARSVDSIMTALQASTVFKKFCEDLIARRPAFFALVGRDGASAIEVVQTLHLPVVTASGAPSNVRACVAFHGKQQAPAKKDGGLSDSKPMPEEPDDIGLEDDSAAAESNADDIDLDDEHDILRIDNVVLTVVDTTDPLTFLMEQLEHIHHPLCTGRSETVSRSIFELINTVKSKDNFLGKFELQKYYHPEIIAVCQANATKSTDELMALLAARVNDKAFVNAVQRLMRECDEEVNAAINASFNVTTIKDEVSLWTNVADWADNAKQQMESREWKLTLQILRKRFSAGMRTANDPLHARAALAKAFRAFFESIPYAKVQAATTAAELADAARQVMEKLKDFTSVSFPGERAARLADALTNEIAQGVVIMLSHSNFVALARDDRSALIQTVRRALNEAANGRAQIIDLANSHAPNRVGAGAQRVDLGDNAFVAHLTKRLDVLGEIVDDYEMFASAVKKVFHSSDSAGVIQNTASAYEGFTNLSPLFWNFDEAAVQRFNAGLQEYRSRINAIETTICSQLSAKFAACNVASENFRVYDEFEPLFHRKMVRDAANTYRTQMMQQVKGEIKALITRFNNETSRHNAILVAGARGISQAVAAMQWGITTLTRLDELMRRRSTVCEHSAQRLLSLRGGQPTWQLNDALARFVGVSLNKLTEVSRRVDSSIYGTAVALSYLELAFDRDRADWSRLTTEAYKFLNDADARDNTSVLKSVHSLMKRLGAGSQVAQDQQDEDEFHKFRQTIVDEVAEKAAAWCRATTRKIDSVASYQVVGGALPRGELTSTVLVIKQQPDRSLQFAVGFPLFVGDLLKDEGELHACGVLTRAKRRSDFLHTPEAEELWSQIRTFIACTQPHFALANTLNSLLQMYYTTAKKCDPDVLVLLAADDHALTKKLAEGIKLKWSSNDARYFVRDVSGGMRSFCEGARNISAWLKRFRDTVTALRKCESEGQALRTWVGRIKTAISELARLAPKNQHQWIARAMPEIEEALLKHLRELVDAWREEFELLSPDARANAEAIRAERRSANPEDTTLLGEVARRFGLTNLNVAIRQVHHSTRLDPPIVACRRHWYNKLNEAIATVVDLPHVVYEGAASNFHYLVARLPEGKLTGAFGAIDTTLSAMNQRLDVWRRHLSLWDVNFDELCEELGTNLDDWMFLIHEVRDAGASIMDSMQLSIDLAGVTLSSAEIMQGVSGKHQQMSSVLLQKFRKVLGDKMIEKYKVFKAEHEMLEEVNVARSMEGALKLLGEKARLNDLWDGWRADLEVLTEAEGLLTGRQQRSLGGDWLYAERVQSEFDMLVAVFKRKEEEVEARRASLQDHVVANVKSLSVSIEQLERDFRNSGVEEGHVHVLEAYAEVAKFNEQAQKLRTDAKTCSAALRALAASGSLPMLQLERVAADIEGLKDVFDALKDSQKEIDELGDKRFSKVDGRVVQQSLKAIDQKLLNLPPSMHTHKPYKVMRVHVSRLLSMSNMITELASEAMGPQNWRELAHELNKPESWSMDLTLGKIWEADPIAHDKLFKRVIVKAQAEMALRTFLDNIKTHWNEAPLEIGSYQGKVNLVKGWDVMFEKLNEHLNSLATMKLSPHFAHVKADSNVLDEQLNQMRQVLDTLVDVQRRWVYLEGIFGASADIRHQLPVESSLFEKTSREFFGVMPKPKKGQLLTILSFAAHDNKLLPSLERIGRELTSVQRALGDYLEAQRASFARFYFVGDEDLLEVIGNGKSPLLIAKHLRKMFGGIAALELEDETKITAFTSSEAESVVMTAPIDTTNVKVNDWLSALAQGMTETLAERTHLATREIPADPQSFIAWLGKFPNQVACLALQAKWTHDVEVALKTPGKVADVAANMSGVLDVLALAVLSPDLAPVLRSKIEQIITVSVYQRDQSRMLAASKATSTSFQWLATLRISLSDQLAPGCKTAKGVDCTMADATFPYSFEYLGIADRLVQTPLTDKCYLTLTQALHTKLGGSPSGPAGTGKTETVKALGAQLGRFVLVFCCDEAFDFKSMGRIFVGLCQVGAWGCFDEFNRLEERILSAVSQQIQTIQEGLRDSTPQVELVERKVQLHRNVGVFITMNPGYAGRSPLPDNLKQLFRAVAMTAPDRENIAEVMLFAQGFRTAEALSRKVVPLFKLCKDQLSNQSHYDFGLRALKSVLISAGSLKRGATAAGKGTMTAADETNLMIQSLVETMVPKLIASDAALFFPLLRDVFPGFEPDTLPLKSLRDAVERQCAARGFVMSEAWLGKIEQLYKILQVNHGVMLVGRSGTGKTAAWTALLHALADLEDVDGHAYVIDPKALTKGELYGVLDNTTRDWRDGVFTATLRRIVDNLKGDDQSKKRHWILFDGDVDPEWVENLNSLLDDNKLLTLPNGERLALPPNVRIMFEVQDLKYATLATVSRCGMVWFSEETMPVENYIAEMKHTMVHQPLSQRATGPVNQFAERRSATQVKKGTAERTAEQQAQLDLQHQVLRYVDDAFTPDGLIVTAVQNAKEYLRKKGIMEWNTLQSLRAFFNLFVYSVEIVRQRIERSGHMDDESMKAYIKRRLSFALSWGLASGCSIDSRNAFAQHLKLPETPPGSIFEYDVAVEDGAWVEWKNRVPPTELPANKVGTNDVVIPTVDTARHESVIAAWLHSGRPVILCGPPGSGKTMSLTAVLRSSPDYDCAFLNFSSATTSHTVLKLLEEYATYKNTMKGMVLTPVSGKRLIIFCDEINLPSADKYGTQQVVQLLRQLTERNGFYRAKDNTWITLENIQFAGACNPPTDPGRTPLTHRFLRWAPVLFVDFPSYESLLQIYNTYCRALLHKNARLRAVSDCLAKAMVDSYKGSQVRFTPDMQAHYVYSPRELSRWSRAIYEGISSLDEARQKTMRPEDLVRLAVHEGLRLFRDRLVTEAEQQWTDKHMDECFTKAFPGLDTTCLSRPLLFTTVLTRAYTSVDIEELRKHVQERLKMFADEELDVQLVVFDSMLDHVIRIDRVLRQPLGHMLLAGASGVGKTVLSKFAAWLGNMSVFQIKAHRGYTLKDFEDDLRTIMKRAGCKREKIVFLFDESNIMDSGFLEYMNALLASAEVPGLFDGDEWSQLIHQIREGITTSGQTESVDQTVETELYRWFIQQVSLNLHVIFTMNPANAEFSNRAATSPALFNRCTIDWFGNWNRDTMVTVARELTAKLDVADSNPEVFKDAQSAHAALATCLFRMHDHVYLLNEKLRASAGNRGTFITPRHFLDFIEQFRKLFKDKKTATHELQRHLQGGLGKLRDTAQKVNEQQLLLREKEIVLAESSLKAQKMLSALIDEKARAERAKREAEVLADQLAEESKQIEAQRAKAEGELAEAQPALDDAAAALSTIKKEDLREIRAYATPPAMVKKVLEAVITTLGEKRANDWDVIKTYTRKDDFITQVRDFKPSQLTEELKEKVKKNFVSTPDFTVDLAQRASKAAGPLVKWVIAQIRYADIHVSIKPLTESIARLSAAYDEKAAFLDKAKRDVVEYEAALERLQNEYSDMTQQNNAIKTEITLVKSRCDRATALVGNLTSERDRWESQASNFRTEMTAVLGDCLIAGAFLAYIGYYDEQVRKKQILPEWCDIFDSSKIQYRRQLALTEYLSRPEKRMQWAANKLPQDDLCIENAIILDRFRRYPLVIDPSGQAAEFLAAEFAGRKLTKTSFLDKNFLKQLELCVRFGTPCIINDAEHVDPVLNPLLNHEIKKTGGRNLVRLGAQDIDISPVFSMILTTRDSTYQFPPDVAGRVTTINFTVTPSVLQSQVLHLVLHNERPDIEVKRSDLLKLQGEYTLKLRVLEDDLLTAIASSEGMILENEGLIKTLENLKEQVSTVTEKMRESHAAFADIESVEEACRPTAVVASLMYFSLDQLSVMCPTYCFSLHFFFSVVDQAFSGLPEADFHERLRYINRRLFAVLNVRVSRSMYHADHRTWLLRLAQLRATIKDRVAQAIPATWWDMLLGTGLKTSSLDMNSLPSWVPASVPTENRLLLAAFFADQAAFPIAASAKQDTQKWQAYVTREADAPPADAFSRLEPHVAALARAIIAKTVLPSDFNSAADRFLTELFDHAEKLDKAPILSILSTAHLYDIVAVLPELDAGTPLLLLSSPGYDASQKVEALARDMRVRIKSIAMGSGEALDESTLAVTSAMQNGTWVLLKNVHLCPSYLDDLEKRLHTAKLEGNVGKDFRLVLAAESTDKLPRGLLRSSRMLVFEPPPGIKSSMTRTFTSSVAELPDQPAELVRLAFVASWLHAVIIERTRYVPLGWSKTYEFSEVDYHRMIGTCVAWTQQVANGRRNLPPNEIPWHAIRQLVRDTVYGGKIDNPVDQELVASLAATYLCPAVFSPEFKFEGRELTCDKFTMEDLSEWIARLPDVEPPEWLGLPPSATTMVLEQTAQRTITMLQRVQLSVLAESTSDAKAAGPAWAVKLDGVLKTLRGIVPNKTLAAGGNPKNTDPIHLALVREVATANAVMKTAAADLAELQAIVKGEAKATNHARKLIDVLLHDSSPPTWRPYPLALNLPLTAWATDLAFRVSNLETLVADANPTTVDLGALFNPGAFVTATRQKVARQTSTSLEALRLQCGFSRKNELSFVLKGVTLVGAEAVNDKLMLTNRPSTDISLVINWTSEPSPTDASSFSSVPLYLNEQRIDLIAMCELPVQGDAAGFTRQGVCLSAWRRR